MKPMQANIMFHSRQKTTHINEVQSCSNVACCTYSSTLEWYHMHLVSRGVIHILQAIMITQLCTHVCIVVRYSSMGGIRWSNIGKAL